ncbi:hypothetical protein [Nocardia fluminea]|uniref:hypothetical protein n=1 Tax=Nocardia fluminea TaxID=134984 RepID=UPI003666FDC6
MTTESTAEAHADPAHIRQQIQASIAYHSERKRHDRDYLNHLVAGAKKILEDHTAAPDSAVVCRACGKGWPCGSVQMLLNEGYWID